MISIIIPAYNEEAVIERCLNAILNGAEPDELEVIVACNGCSDRTAERARGFSDVVQVIEIEQASKTAALNAADEVTHVFPRIYVDADVVLPIDSIRKIAMALQNDEKLLVSPKAFSNTSLSSAAVKAFYDIWTCLPYNQVMVGTGVYALSKLGRARFEKFPNIIADDGFVRSRFFPEERANVNNATVVVFAPKSLKDLLKVKTRSRLGGFELARRFPQKKTSDPKSFFSIVKSLPWGLCLPWKLTIYLLVNLISRIRAFHNIKNLSNYIWEQDRTTRV